MDKPNKYVLKLEIRIASDLNTSRYSLSGEGLRLEKAIALSSANFDTSVANIKRFLALAEQIEKENTK